MHSFSRALTHTYFNLTHLSSNTPEHIQIRSHKIMNWEHHVNAINCAALMDTEQVSCIFIIWISESFGNKKISLRYKHPTTIQSIQNMSTGKKIKSLKSNPNCLFDLKAGVKEEEDFRFWSTCWCLSVLNFSRRRLKANKVSIRWAVES